MIVLLANAGRGPVKSVTDYWPWYGFGADAYWIFVNLRVARLVLA